MSTKTIYLPYGKASTFRINLMNSTGVSFANGLTLAAGDFVGETDTGGSGNLNTLPVAAGLGYIVSVSVAETTGKIFDIQATDVSATDFLADGWIIETTGHPLAQHPFKDIDTGISTGVVNTVNGTPSITTVPTSIQAEAAANTFPGGVAYWFNPLGSYGRGEITANTAGSNTVLTVTAVSVAPVDGARVFIV